MSGSLVRLSGGFAWLCVIACLTLQPSSLQAQPYLYDRGNGLIYNSWQDLTWLKDSKYIKTIGLDSDGLVSRTVAKSFAENLVVAGLSDWRMPYDSTYSGGDMYMLYGTFNSTWDPPVSKGPFINIDWKTPYWVEGGGIYSGNWFMYDFGSAVPSGVHPTYAGDVYGVWPCRVGDVWGIDPNIDHQMDNGSFSEGFAGWSAAGTGTIDITVFPGTTNTVAWMKTASPVQLWQRTDTAAMAFFLRFDYDMAQVDGEMAVYLDGTLLGTVSGHHGELVPAEFAVTDPALLGKSAAELKFSMDGATAGLIAYIDNVRMEPLPEPGSAMTIAAAAAAFSLQRRRRR